MRLSSRGSSISKPAPPPKDETARVVDDFLAGPIARTFAAPADDALDALDATCADDAFRLDMRLEPGDALLIPAFWHHAVVSHPGAPDACDACGALALRLCAKGTEALPLCA